MSPCQGGDFGTHAPDEQNNLSSLSATYTDCLMSLWRKEDHLTSIFVEIEYGTFTAVTLVLSTTGGMGEAATVFSQTAGFHAIPTSS